MYNKYKKVKNKTIYIHSIFLQHICWKQGGSQQQGKLQDAAVASSGDQVVTDESGWASKELMDLIEAVPYYDQFIRSLEEMK